MQKENKIQKHYPYASRGRSENRQYYSLQRKIIPTRVGVDRQNCLKITVLNHYPYASRGRSGKRPSILVGVILSLRE